MNLQHKYIVVNESKDQRGKKIGKNYETRMKVILTDLDYISSKSCNKQTKMNSKK